MAITKMAIGFLLTRGLILYVFVLGSPTTASAASYADDIRPIFAEHCVSCHQPGEIAPMSLTTYTEVFVLGLKRSLVRSQTGGCRHFTRQALLVFSRMTCA